MGRSWDRYDASLEDIKRCRRAIISQFPNATDIFYDEYLVDRHQNESCNANKFYYGAVMETKDGRFQAATSYGRIGDYTKAFGGIKAFNEGVFTNFDSAKRKLNDKLDKKKGGKVCRKCKTRQSYSPFAPKNAEEYGAEDWQTNDEFWEYMYLNYGEKFDNNGHIEMTNSELRKIAKKQGFAAEAMSPQVFGKLAGQYPQPPNNPLPVGGFMDEGFEWTVNQAENKTYNPYEYAKKKMKENNERTDLIRCQNCLSKISFNETVMMGGDPNFRSCKVCAEEDFYKQRPHLKNMESENEDGWFAVSYVSNEEQAKNQKREIEEFYGASKGRYEYKIKENPDKKGWSVLARSIFSMKAEKEEFGSSNIVSKVKDNWLNSLIGLGVGLVAFDFLKKKGYVANADTLIESPNTGDLTPADYEEIVVESTGYAVPIIPVSLDGSFMGSRFHALPTDRYVYDSPEGIGANIDVAMKRNTNFLPNEESLVQASEAPGQSPYNSMQPNGQENTDFPLRVIHETTTVSLDPSTASFIPTDLSGYTGQQFVPTSVYEDMLGVGISGRIPSFSQPASGDIGSNHFGSRIANPDMLTNVGGPLKEDVNGDYTDGNITKSLSQWSIENQVQQISDTEAIVVERGSGGRKMIRRV